MGYNLRTNRGYNPLIVMEHNHGGLVQIIFLSKWVICRFHVNLPGCIQHGGINWEKNLAKKHQNLRFATVGWLRKK